MGTKVGFILGILLPLLSLNSTAQCIKGDCVNGYGIYQFKSGATYKGNFDNRKMNGQGELFFSNGDRYVGQWEWQHRQGKGKLELANGSVYVGNFYNNHFEGHGVMTYADGGEYDGEWKKGERSGNGIMVYPDGSRYEGSWAKDLQHGSGSWWSPDGRVVSGHWSEGKREGSEPSLVRVDSKSELRDCNTVHCEVGKGRYRYADGSRYEGEFVKGKPEGQGKCYYANGDFYQGQWKNHAPHGEGIYTYKNKRTIAAIWRKGEPVRPLETFVAADLEDNLPAVAADNRVRVWAVVVGVSTYNHMPSLRFTDDDAYRMYAFLKSPEGGALTDHQIRVLIDEDATRNNILNALQNTFLQADENDVILFYYSGHGLEGSFIPADYDGFNNQLLHDEIKMVFEKSRAKHKIIFADACYSGSLQTVKSAWESDIKKYYEAYESTKGGLAFFTSSKGEEISLEDQGLRQGVFTHYLIRGLLGEANSNNDRLITIRELYGFVSRHVREYTANVQSPMIIGDFDENMPVAMLRR